MCPNVSLKYEIIKETVEFRKFALCRHIDLKIEFDPLNIKFLFGELLNFVESLDFHKM